MYTYTRPVASRCLPWSRFRAYLYSKPVACPLTPCPVLLVTPRSLRANTVHAGAGVSAIARSTSPPFLPSVVTYSSEKPVLSYPQSNMKVTNLQAEKTSKRGQKQHLTLNIQHYYTSSRHSWLFIILLFECAENDIFLVRLVSTLRNPCGSKSGTLPPPVPPTYVVQYTPQTRGHLSGLPKPYPNPAI